jgi:hypothetical protein
VNSFSLETFVADVLDAAEADAAQHSKAAPKFSLYDGVIDVDENKISDMLAMLLDPVGTHAQGATFLNLFLRRLGAAPVRSAVVEREAVAAATGYRRIDILVESPNFVLAIETKRNSGEQPTQASDYLRHLEIRKTAYAFVYLTKGGTRAPSVSHEEQGELIHGSLNLMSYGDLAEWLEDCSLICAADYVRGFILDFQRFIKREIEIMDEQIAGPKLQAVISQNEDNLRAGAEIVSAWPSVMAVVGENFTEALAVSLVPKWQVERGDDLLNGEWGGLSIFRGPTWGDYRVRLETCMPNRSDWREVVVGIYDRLGRGLLTVQAVELMRSMGYDAKKRHPFWEAGHAIATRANFWDRPEILWKMKSSTVELAEGLAAQMDELGLAAEARGLLSSSG